MSQKIAYVVPSRGRPENIKRLAKAFEKTEARADLWVVIDDNDWERKAYEKNAEEYDYGYLIIENHSNGMAQPLNKGVEILINRDEFDEYGYFGFMGDDHLPRTPYFDYILSLAIPYGKNGIAWGNDLIQGGNLPTACLMNREIVERLGGMVPPGFKHLYIDNFWMTLGRDINGLYYKPDVIIEHLHPVARKSEMDEGYARVNSQEMYDHDRAIIEEYINSQEYKDLVAVLKC
jgi:hypothetical protein